MSIPYRKNETREAKAMLRVMGSVFVMIAAIYADSWNAVPGVSLGNMFEYAVATSFFLSGVSLLTFSFVRFRVTEVFGEDPPRGIFPRIVRRPAPLG